MIFHVPPSIWNETCIDLPGLSEQPFPYKRSVRAGSFLFQRVHSRAPGKHGNVWGQDL